MRTLVSRFVALMLAVGLLAGIAPTAPAALAQTTPDSDIRITITEDFISHLLETQLASALEGQQMQIENPRIDIKPGSQIDLTLATTVPLLGNVEPTISIEIAINNNQLDLTFGTIKISGATVPAAMLGGQIAPIEQMAEEQGNQALADLAESAGIELAGITSTETLLTIYLRTAE